jgi:uncharacterized protein
MTCLTCGATLETTDTSCPVCSAPVTPEASPTAAGPPTRPTTSPTTEPPAGRPDTPALGPGPAATGSTSRAAGDAGGGPTAPGWPPAASHPSGLSSETRGWGIAAHLSGLGGALLTAVTLGFAGPLVVWLLKREDHPFIDHHAKEALNFQLTTLLALVVGTLAAIPVFLLGFLTFGLLWLIAIIAVAAATVVWFIFPIIGAVRAGNGEGYRYPINIRFVR